MSSATGGTPPEEGATLLSFARMMRRRRRIVFALTFGLPALAAVVLLLTPNRYTATGTVLVETPQGGLGPDLLSRITAVAGLPAQASPIEMYLAILKSERVALSVADSLDLAGHYGIEADQREEREEETLRMMSEWITFDTPDAVSITISATDRSREVSAAIVNAYLGALERASETLALSRARKTRVRVEAALVETVAHLDSTRAEMRRFQERHGVFSIEQQTQGTLELIAALQAELLAAQTERDALGGYVGEGAGRLKALDFKIAALSDRIASLVGKLEGETAATARPRMSGAGPEESGSFLIPLTDLPRLAGQYAHILINLKVQEAKYSLLATQLEQVRIEESESIPAFEMLDHARVPHRKSGPRRSLFVLAAFLGGMLASILLAVFLDDLDRRVDPETRRELGAILPDAVRRFRRQRSGHGSRG